MNCCRVACDGKKITTEQKRVEVKGTLSKEFSKIRNRTQVNWPANGELQFHRNCWELVFKAATVEKSKKSGMTYIEKEMLKEASLSAEFFDDQKAIQKCAEVLHTAIKAAKFALCFTGAGISTSAGISDFRGKNGKWTEEDRERDRKRKGTFEEDSPVEKKLKHSNESGEASGSKDSDDEVDVEDGVPYERLRPTYTHEAIAWLVANGHIKHVISQNGDGLHGLSGIVDSKLSELHGNVFIEKCVNCEKQYKRPYYVLDDVASQYYEELDDFGASALKKPKHAERCKYCKINHNTGRKCSDKNCKGQLRDTIINFRDHLNEEMLEKCDEMMKKSDLVLCLGSTLSVRPANLMLKHADSYIIINRQPTDLDASCTLVGSRCFGNCDDVFRLAMPLIMGNGACEKWEDDRTARIEEYNKQREKSE